MPATVLTPPSSKLPNKLKNAEWPWGGLGEDAAFGKCLQFYPLYRKGVALAGTGMRFFVNYAQVFILGSHRGALKVGDQGVADLIEFLGTFASLQCTILLIFLL
jgi:hypothetical protein